LKIFFDVDGVIIEGWHFNPERRRPWDTNLEQDFGINRDAFQKAFYFPPAPGQDSLMEKCLKGESDLTEVLSKLLPTLGYTGLPSHFIGYWFSRNSHLNEDVIEIIKRLQRQSDVELYLATAQEPNRANYLWNDLGFKKLFRDIFYTARFGVSKDTVAFFSKINTELNIGSDEHPLYFDDTPNVIKAAQAAGWDAHEFDTLDDLTGNSRIIELLE